MRYKKYKIYKIRKEISHASLCVKFQYLCITNQEYNHKIFTAVSVNNVYEKILRVILKNITNSAVLMLNYNIFRKAAAVAAVK